MISTAKNITKKSKTSVIIKVPKFKPTWKGYTDNYPVTQKGQTILMYKTVHKSKDGTYTADYDKSFVYKIGETYTLKNDTSTRTTCSFGLHVAHKSWALSFGCSWEDVALIECVVDPKDIVVSEDCDGKVRTSKLTVIREVPKEEWYV